MYKCESERTWKTYLLIQMLKGDFKNVVSNLFGYFQHKLSSYAIELLAIKTYENFNRPQPGGITEEKIVNGIFEQLKDCKNMKVEWNTNYNLDDYGRPYVFTNYVSGYMKIYMLLESGDI